MRVLTTVFLLFLLCSTGLAQQPPCSVPVNVIAPDLSSLSKADADLVATRWKEHTKGGARVAVSRDSDWLWHAEDYVSWLGGRVLANWNLVQQLPATAFVAQDKKHPLQVQSATTDRGPRRVIFVVENGKGMPAKARKAEAAVISDILSKARSEDSFGLLTALGPRLELRFGSSRDAIQSAAEGLANASPAKSDGKGVLDAVLEASTWFHPRQPGDSICLMTMHLEGINKASLSSLRSALAAGRIRAFGFQLGGDSLSLPTAKSTEGNVYYFFKVFALTGSTGGMAYLHYEMGPGEPTDRELEVLQGEAAMMYQAMTEYYLVQVTSTGPGVAIDLAPSVRSQLPMARVLYPRNLPQCPAVP